MYHEIMHLESVLAAAMRNPLSCPRDRSILLSKILDLETERSRIESNLGLLRTKVVDLADLDAKRERFEHNLCLLQAKIVELALVAARAQGLKVEAARVIELVAAERDAQEYSDYCDLRLWELEAQIG